MAGFTGAPPIVTDGLVFAIDIANYNSYPGNGTSVYDLVGIHDSQLNNGPSYSSNNGGYLQFDGTNDYLIITGSLSNDEYAWTADNSVGSDILCLEIWFKTSDTEGRLISKAWNGDGRYNYRVEPSYFGLVVGNGGGVDDLDSYQTLSFPSVSSTRDGNWHQLVIWANDTTMGYYIDGNSASNTKVHGLTGGVSNRGNNSLHLGLMTLYFYTPEGTWTGNTGHAVEGDVAIFRKYNRVLSSQEVLQNYNALKSRFNL